MGFTADKSGDMYRNLMLVIVFLFPLHLLGVEHTSLDSLLTRDYHILKQGRPHPLFVHLSKEDYVGLFSEGITESLSFMKTVLHKRRSIRLYKKGIKQVKKDVERADHCHGISPYSLDHRMKTSLRKWSHQGHDSFDAFVGEWFGMWKTDFVNHLWLPSHHLGPDGIQLAPQLILQAVQSVFTGDGIAWNFMVQAQGQTYLLGYACHAREDGKIYLKRPHLGLAQQDQSVIWITKDHIYSEFVCHDPTCRGLPRHYVISGLYFGRKKTYKMEIKEVFQAIYTDDPTQRPRWAKLNGQE